MKIRTVAIADSQFLVRYALKKLIEDFESYQVIGEALNEEDLALLFKERIPDLLFIDHQATGFSLENIQYYAKHFPLTKIIILSADENRRNIFKAIEWGINGYLTKFCDDQEIKDALRLAAKNEKYFCARVVDYLVEKSLTKSEKSIPVATLSPREIEVVQLVAQGLVAKEIGALLNLSPHTIYTHRKKIMRKLAMKSTSELVRYAIQEGIIAND